MSTDRRKRSSVGHWNASVLSSPFVRASKPTGWRSLTWRGIDPTVRVFTIDTGRLPQETYALLDQVREKYDMSIEVYFPDATQVEAWCAVMASTYSTATLSYGCSVAKPVKYCR
jgi:3'-phosphoadenosine 5'-phosphosulfate sulfotransferase (PAPS reductase)/FAD synthetase